MPDSGDHVEIPPLVIVFRRLRCRKRGTVETGRLGKSLRSNFSGRAGFASTLCGSSSGRFPMIPMTENGFDRRWQGSRAIEAGLHEVSLEERVEQAAVIKEQLDDLRSWCSPNFRRAYSAGQLLFQVIGAAGYAGYFASMHTLMRLFSGALMAGAWYVIYRVKGGGQTPVSQR